MYPTLGARNTIQPYNHSVVDDSVKKKSMIGLFRWSLDCTSKSRDKIITDAHAMLTACPFLHFTSTFLFDEKPKKKLCFPQFKNNTCPMATQKTWALCSKVQIIKWICIFCLFFEMFKGKKCKLALLSFLCSVPGYPKNMQRIPALGMRSDFSR